MDDLHYPICEACGTQYGVSDRHSLMECRICQDPRQFIPPTGQSWTTLVELRQKHKNKWRQDEGNPNVWIIWTEPKFAIGQCMYLICTPQGNILWELISLLDEETIQFIKSKGPVKTIVVSHPHWYTSYSSWTKAFDCRIQVSSEDKEWVCASTKSMDFIEEESKNIIDGLTIYKAGGHFEGSLIMYWDRVLFHADTIVLTPAARGKPRPKGHICYTFLWSIPNNIPLSPRQIQRIWSVIKPLEFETARGGFENMALHEPDVKSRILEAAKVQLRAMGVEDLEKYVT